VRAQMTITDLDQESWDYLQRNVRAEYKIPQGTTRVCLTFSREAEERHVELPLVTMITLLAGLVVSGAAKALGTRFPGLLTKAREEADQPKPYGFGPDGSVVALDQDGKP
jgi:hypothetical protein